MKPGVEGDQKTGSGLYSCLLVRDSPRLFCPLSLWLRGGGYGEVQSSWGVQQVTLVVGQQQSAVEMQCREAWAGLPRIIKFSCYYKSTYRIHDPECGLQLAVLQSSCLGLVLKCGVEKISLVKVCRVWCKHSAL